MSNKTRYFMIGAVALLVVGLSIGLVAYYNGGIPGLAAGSAPSDLQYVPDNAVVVAYANVHQIMTSEFRQRFKQLETGKTESGQQEFRDQTGIDIERDVDSVLAFATGDPNAADKAGAVLVTGRFDQPRLVNLAKEKGAAVGDYRGKPMIEFKMGEHEGQGGALVFLRGDLVAVGSTDAIKRIVDVSSNPNAPTVKSNAKMEELIGEVNSKGNAWVVGRFDALRNQAKLPDALANQIPPISWFAASGQINGGVSADLTVETVDPAAAENLKKVVDGLVGLAGLQVGQKAPQMQQLLQSFALRQDGARLSLSFRLPTDLLMGLAGQKRQEPPKH